MTIKNMFCLFLFSVCVCIFLAVAVPSVHAELSEQLVAQPVTPVPQANNRIPELLNRADAYFDDTFFVEPPEGNAFALYKEVLTLDPSNEHAREKIYEMTRLYYDWGNRENTKGNNEKSIRYYQRYLLLVPYIVQTFGDQQIEEQSKVVQQYLVNAGVLEEQKTQPPMPTPTPAISSTPVPELPPIATTPMENLLKTADTYFTQEYFTTGPDGKNALELYKEALRLDPANQHARQQLVSMVKIYQEKGKAAAERAEYEKAKTMYQRSLQVAEYLSKEVREPRISSILQDIQQQLYTLEQQQALPVSTPLPVETSEVRSLADILKEIQTRLASHLAGYTRLKENSVQGMSSQSEMAATLQNLIQDLQELEHLYVQFFPEMTERIENIHKTRILFEENLAQMSSSR